MDEKIFVQFKKELEANNLEKAINILKNEYGKNPGDLDCLYNLGFASRMAGNWEQAEKYYLESLKINPDQPTVYLGLGIVYQLKGDLDKSIETLREATRDPKLINAFISLGLTYKKKGEYIMSIETYLTGIKNMFRDAYSICAESIKSEMIGFRMVDASEWYKLAAETIIAESKKEGINSIFFPTGESSLNFYKQTNGVTCWVDKDNKRYVAPQYFDAVREMLRSNNLYSTITNNLGVTFAEAGNKINAKKWFLESIAFIPEGIDYPNPYIALKELGA